MRAFGMQRGMVRNVFLVEALLLSAGGALAGLVLYGLTSLILGQISWQTMPQCGFSSIRAVLHSTPPLEKLG